MAKYQSLFPAQTDTLANHGAGQGIGLDIDRGPEDVFGSDDWDLMEDAILELEKYLKGTTFCLEEYLYHCGDLDTYLRFDIDRLRVVVGGVDILDITEAGADAVVWNEGGVDVDFRWEASGVLNALFIQGSDGAVTLGGPLLTLVGGQINFPAAQVPSADAHTLDDYEEGTWTAELRGNTSAANVPVTITALYTKIGDVVKVHGAFVNRDTTGAAGQLQIAGLPFVTNAAMEGAWVPGYPSKLAFTAGSHPTGYFNSADTKLLGIQHTSAGVAATWDVSAVAATYLYFCATYKV